MNNPYTTDELIELLETFWEKATGLDYGQEHEVMRCAADRLRKLKTERAILDRRIHNQRHQNRVTWEIVEMRRKWMGGEASRRAYARLLLRHRRLLHKHEGFQFSENMMAPE